MKYNLSYLMGAKNIEDSVLEDLGVVIEDVSKSGSRMLKIPEASLSGYIALMKDKLGEGFWNEIIGPENITFIFKLKNGEIKEYVLSPDNEQEIDNLCAELNNEPKEKTANVYKYISENDFYHDFMLEHYSNMINR